MRILDRYLLRELLIPFGYCLGGFWIFWMAFDLFAEMAEFQRNGCTAGDLVQYYALKTPEMLVMVLPIAFLLALLYALTDMTRHQELTAMRAAGLGLWRISVPYLAVGLLLSAGVFCLNELWVSESIEAAAAIKHKRRLAEAPSLAGKHWKHQLGFVNTRQRRKWFMEAYNTVTSEMIRPHVEWTLTTGTRLEIWAERGVFRDGVWIFTNVQERVFSSTPGEIPNVNATNLYIASFTETPEEIESEIKISNINDLREVNRTQLSIREILNYRNLHAEDISPMLETKLHGRLAAPWTCFVVVLIALPFGAGAGRRNVFVGVASSIVICFAYFVLMQLAMALGTRGSAPPWLAAWAPNVLFALTGIALTWRVR